MAEMKRTKGAAPAPAPAKVEPQVAPVAKSVFVVPVHGPMHHPYLNMRIEGITEVPAMDSWIRSQVDAGKLQVK